MNRGEPLTVRPGVVTPCCGRVPLPIGHDRYACRACGVIYRDAAAVVADGFGAVVDVTPVAPFRLVPRIRWRA